MFKYKWDSFQIAVFVTYIIFFISLLYFPYKYNQLTEEVYYGYKSFLHWVLIIYMLRLSLHVFGWEVYNLKGNLMAVGIIIAGSSYFKYLFGRKEGFEIMWSGVLIPILTLAIVIGILLLDMVFYTMERRET